jgi:hypothetical protein
MLLSDSVLLLGDQGKYFSDVYKLYEYKDDQTLKDYLDFVIHEPVEWMRGFPSKMITKGSFSKPKSALIKLLKQESVITALGESYVKKVHDIVWAAFKKNADDIVASRNKTATVSVVDQLDADDLGAPSLVIDEDIQDAESIHSVRLPRKPAGGQGAVDWEKRYRILEAAYKDLVNDLSASFPGLGKSTLTLLDALSSV